MEVELVWRWSWCGGGAGVDCGGGAGVEVEVELVWRWSWCGGVFCTH